jgi:hypothetical protein
MDARARDARSTRHLVIALLALAAIVGFAAIVVAANRGALPAVVRRLYDWPGGDKVGHVVLLAIVTLLVELALRDRRIGRGRWAPRLGVVLVAVAITAEEASQAFVPGRTFSLVDLACSYVGIALGARGATWRRAPAPDAVSRA